MKVKLASQMQSDSIVDGEGLRTVIWMQGCSHNCKGCHNPETHDFTGGFEIEIEEVKKQLEKLQNQDGITLSGGDPFFQPEAAYEIAKYAHERAMTVWCYTGFTWEDLLQKSKTQKAIKNLLNEIDVLIDGKFILEQKSLNLYYRGSKNQRILDTKASFKQNKAIEMPEYQNREEFTLEYGRKKNMYI